MIDKMRNIQTGTNLSFFETEQFLPETKVKYK